MMSAFDPLRTFAPSIADIASKRHPRWVKAYAILPYFGLLEEVDAMSAEQSGTLDLIATLVADALQQGGDRSHTAIIWDHSPILAGTPPTVVALPEREGLIAAIRRCLDPIDVWGGDIRSNLNCRMATFGYDGQAYVRLRHEDVAPKSPDSDRVKVEEPRWLLETDWFDGAWPNA